jgi:hypothetical protein
MPVVPMIDAGLSPLMQWIVISTVTVRDSRLLGKAAARPDYRI